MQPSLQSRYTTSPPPPICSVGLSQWLRDQESACTAGDARAWGLILRLGRSSGGENGNPLQYYWKIPWAEEPGRLQSIASQRVGQDWANEHNVLSCSFCSQFHLLPQSQAIRQPLTCFLALQIDFSRISHKWNHTVCALLCLVYLLSKMFFEIYLWYCVSCPSWAEFCWTILLFIAEQSSILWLYHNWFIYSLGCFWLLLWMNLLWTLCISLCGDVSFHFTWINT